MHYADQLTSLLVCSRTTTSRHSSLGAERHAHDRRRRTIGFGAYIAIRQASMASAVLLAPIAKYRVSANRPPRPEKGLDVGRCSALHNTLLLYGWVCSGKKIPEMPRKSWWSSHGSASLEKLLRPEMVQYLAKIFDVPGHNIFYHLSGLARPPEMLRLGDVLADPDRDSDSVEKYRFLVLYTTSKMHVSQPAGIVFDQQTNLAILMPTYHHIFDLKDKNLPWQPLESILSSYFDMIEVEKAVAVLDSYGEDSDDSPTEARQNQHQWITTRPWILQPYTHDDLVKCVDAWKALITTLERQANFPPPTDNSTPICSNSALNAAGIPPGFAHQLLRHCPASDITFLAPGIRLPRTEEFIYQPFKPILERFPSETKSMKMPFLFLRCPGTVTAKEAQFRWPFSTLAAVPCGLYLDAFPNAQNPFEDACRLVLPVKLGGGRYARTSDFRPIRRSHSDLYQVDVNPFVMRHGPKLVGILESWLENVKSGHWGVNEKGVTGGVGEWRKADTREDWWRYQVDKRHLYS